jgi:N-acetylglutamate synthase-like GNAT family acetyltransferase
MTRHLVPDLAPIRRTGQGEHLLRHGCRTPNGVWYHHDDIMVTCFYTVMMEAKAQVEPTRTEHLQGIYSLYRRYLAREPNEPRIAMHISQFPSAVLVASDAVVGFVYTTDFAPDILELANILISPEYRNQGYGEELVAYVEATAEEQFSAIILVNSMLYTSAEQKRPATQFYTRRGYEIIGSTQYTNIFYKKI